ncbi:MAG: 5-methylcytosine restriction system specificity protein McrC [Candidatus Hodarchaeales archaeon]
MVTNHNNAIEVIENKLSQSLEITEQQAISLKNSLIHFRAIGKWYDHENKTGFVEIHPIQPGKYKIRIINHIGLIKLPTDEPMGLKINSKFNVDTWGIISFIMKTNFKVNFKDQIQSESIDEVIFAIMRLFVELLLEFWSILKKYQFIKVKSNLRNIRGKIDVVKTAFNAYQLKPYVYCHYEEYSLDQPFNQVLKYTLEIVEPQLTHFYKNDNEIVFKIRRLCNEMQSVSHHRFIVADINRFEYNNTNQQYFGIHQLCKLIIENGFAVPRIGNFSLFGFLLNTWKLFEDFLYAFLTRYKPDNVDFSYQEVFFLKNNTKVRHKFDFVLKTENWWIICDTKYKEKPSSADYHQMGDYCANVKEKNYHKAENIPDIVKFAFIFPVNAEKSLKVRLEKRGHLNIYHIPVILDKTHVKDENYLKGLMKEIIKIAFV